MSRLDPHQALMPSVLDRLIDPEADGTVWRHGFGIEQMVAAVYRDLEDLLNARRVLSAVPADCTEVQSSIVCFGLPDITSLEASTPETRARIGRMLEAIILSYEPRLRDVRATLVDPNQTVQRTVRFRIEARLSVEPAPEVAFDTILELTTGHSTISRGGN
jgi:type VI secretion system protein ImpF